MSKNTLQFFFKNVSIKRQVNYVSKYNAQVIYNNIYIYIYKRSYHKNDDPQQSNIVI
jgi:hypothetical protein